MAGTQVIIKRRREEEEEVVVDENKEAKRHKSFVSFLEQEEKEEQVVVSSQDLSLFLTSLQQELFSDPLPCHPDSHGAHQTPLLDPSTEDWNLLSDPVVTKQGDDDQESVIRHLLEASDDDLGLPNQVGVDRTVSSGDEDFNGLDDDDKQGSSLFYDGLWELEDEAANYYTLLQSQLFM